FRGSGPGIQCCLNDTHMRCKSDVILGAVKKTPVEKRFHFTAPAMMTRLHKRERIEKPNHYCDKL
ncbi:hypothetical protein, partial [Staphylococcus pseudintermedius]|uniref:hypothetical protein n=1 Tax=Staphylococcus pseudintermedius TaxID=283734 RepID=UPI000E3B2811